MIPFTTINWNDIQSVCYKGDSGMAEWKTLQWPGLRIRLVTYSAGYLADHWCQKGHVVHCLKGSFISELADGQQFELKEGMSYVVSDEASSHRSLSGGGVTLLIIDGDFLKP